MLCLVFQNDFGLDGFSLSSGCFSALVLELLVAATYRHMLLFFFGGNLNIGTYLFCTVLSAMDINVMTLFGFQ